MGEWEPAAAQALLSSMPVQGVVDLQPRNGLVVWVDGGFPGTGAQQGLRDAAWACGSTGRAGAFLLPDAVSA